MTHRKGAVWTERWLLALILASLGGTFNLVLAVHRRAASLSSRPHILVPVLTRPTTAPEIPRVAELARSPQPRKPAHLPLPPLAASLPASVEDLTVKILAGMTSAMGNEIKAI